jgi:hypothetical protein
MEKIILTYIGIKKIYGEWKTKVLATWTDKNNNEEYTCLHGNIINTLKPIKGETYEITIKDGFIGNQFIFPVEFKGINNNNHFIYDFRIKRLIKYGENPLSYMSPVNQDYKRGEIFKNEKIFHGNYFGIDKISSSSKYYMFVPEENKPYKFLYVTCRNNGFREEIEIYKAKEVFMLFERDIYNYRASFGTGNEKFNIAIGEFPVIISDKLNKKTIIYDQALMHYRETDFTWHKEWSKENWDKWIVKQL